MKRIVLLAAFALVAAGALAQRVGAIHGAGSTDCGDYLEDRAKGNGGLDATYFSWALGYMSAYNIYSQYPQISPLPGSSTILAYLDKHCRDQPLTLVATGVIYMIGDLGGREPKK